ncbi:MAG TPA: transcription antitermination factor NusB [Jatrophihabitans sp.]|nr:transcription antitermination factor NusB [Jatrophihabitans sp.]
MAPPAGDPARLAAYRTLRAVSADDAYANLVLPRQLAAAGLSGRDAALATELAYGGLRALGVLDEVLRRCSSRPLAEIEPAVLDLLRLGAYQLLKTRIPAHAAVATTVELARSTGNGRAAGFVNAVLRKVAAHDFGGWCATIGEDATPLGRLAVRYSHPGWIVGAFAEALAAETPAAEAEHGQSAEALTAEEPSAELDELEQALAADDARPETHLVGWPGLIDRVELAAQAGGEPGRYSPYAVRLTAGGDPGGLPAIRDGRAAVQDEGSQLCALALLGLPLAGEDERWLDMCAGPGGKAALLAALAAGRNARLTANELHPHRAELVAAITRHRPVELLVGDARELAGSYDRVLLDAPCTGLGALRRRPEARWRRDPADLAGLAELQAGLLDAAVRLTRPGGVIGYVTCSPELSETRRQVEQALARHPELELLDARPAFPGVDRLADAPTVQLWPHRHGTDAMFFAGLRRVG